MVVVYDPWGRDVMTRVTMGGSTDTNRFVDELVERLRENGFAAIRPRRMSGSVTSQPPDLVAGSDGQLYLFALA
jgi:Holliday junction resolvase